MPSILVIRSFSYVVTTSKIQRKGEKFFRFTRVWLYGKNQENTEKTWKEVISWR